MLISRDEVLQGRDKEYPLTPELEKNLQNLLKAVNMFRDLYGKPLIVSSGYRPGKYNQAAGGAKGSLHLSCQAVDFADADGKLKEYCVHNQLVLEACGLWMESPDRTPSWVHLDVHPRSSRIFTP
jgi:uncharacterized protein YcbK (DUF882 family)